MKDAAYQAILHGQALAEELMTTPCVFTRPFPDEWVEDPETGYDVPAPPGLVYEGLCKVATYEAHERAADVGGATLVVQRYYVHVPVGAGPFMIGDVCQVLRPGTVIPAGTTLYENSIILGDSFRNFRVAGLHEKTWQTAQRLLVDEGV